MGIAIDYIIDQPCPVKDELTQQGLISLIKQRERAMSVLALLVRGGMKRDQALKTVIGLQVKTPFGTTATLDYRISELLDEARPLDTLQTHCETCLAGRGEPFGCLKTVNYPLSAKAEDWLAAIFQESLRKGLPYSEALEYIHANRISGDQFRQMRADPGSNFLEHKKPFEITIGKTLLLRKTVNADQVLFFMLGLGKVKNPGHMTMLLYLAGALNETDIKPLDDSCEMAVSSKGKIGREVWRSFNLPETGGDDQSIKELKEYFRTMFVAYVLDRELIVEL